MPNIMVVRLLADDWTELKPPCACGMLVVQNASLDFGFQFRAKNDNVATEISYSKGFAVPIGNGYTMPPDETVGWVKGGELIISVGLGLPMPIA